MQFLDNSTLINFIQGYIKFGSEKIGFESQASREDDILSHSARQDHFTNYGVSKQTLKVKGKGFNPSYCPNSLQTLFLRVPWLALHYFNYFELV